MLMYNEMFVFHITVLNDETLLIVVRGKMAAGRWNKDPMDSTTEFPPISVLRTADRCERLYSNRTMHVAWGLYEGIPETLVINLCLFLVGILIHCYVLLLTMTFTQLKSQFELRRANDFMCILLPLLMQVSAQEHGSLSKRNLQTNAYYVPSTKVFANCYSILPNKGAN